MTAPRFERLGIKTPQDLPTEPTGLPVRTLQQLPFSSITNTKMNQTLKSQRRCEQSRSHNTPGNTKCSREEHLTSNKNDHTYRFDLDALIAKI